MNDYEFQIKYVKDSSLRMLWMQDMQPESPTFGCFHYPYWRDKVADFADVRFQEAGAALGLLIHPEFHDDSLPPKETLYAAFSTGLKFWCKQQHSDGSFDEWYKNEHGFAATVFPIIAYGLAIHFLGDSVKNKDKEIFLQTASKASHWLLKHDDFVKMNHQAAGACALSIVYRLTGNKIFSSEAAKKHRDVVSSQKDEGWFNEIAGMDFGYCGVLLDYMMLYRYISQDDSGLIPMQRLYAFMRPFIQPDMTLSAEPSICLNTYLSRIGTVLLSEYSHEAAEIAKILSEQNSGFRGVEPYLADDLRLCRWSCFPLVAGLVKTEMSRKNSFIKAYDGSKICQEDIFNREANVFAYRNSDLQVHFFPSGAGMVRAFSQDDNIHKIHQYHDAGYSYSDKRISKHPLITGGYSNLRKTNRQGNAITACVKFVPAKFFFPPFFFKVVLRIGCAIPALSLWLRKLIDSYRQRKGTAINQSIAPLSGKDSGIALYRTLIFQKDHFKIVDLIKSKKKETKLQLSNLSPRIFNDGAEIKMENLFEQFTSPDIQAITITKVVRLSKGDHKFAVSFSVEKGGHNAC
jgi:hypothetical protein